MQKMYSRISIGGRAFDVSDEGLKLLNDLLTTGECVAMKEHHDGTSYVWIPDTRVQVLTPKHEVQWVTKV